MKFKVIQNQVIVAVLDGLTYVKQYNGGLILPCSADKDPMGILSEDGSIVWHLEGFANFISGDYATVKIAEITDEEYTELKTALGADEVIEQPEELPSPVDETEPTEDDSTEEEQPEVDEDTEEQIPPPETVAKPEPVMSLDAMRQKILELEAKVSTLEAEKEALVTYHETASDASVNSIAKMRAASSQTVANITAIKDGVETTEEVSA